MNEFFGLLDILFFVGWFLIFAIGAQMIYFTNIHKPEYKYYISNFYFKILLGLLFGLVYSVYYEGGGDTIAYWRGSKALSNLFLENPSAYFSEIFRNPENKILPSYYTVRTGFPPSWIYSEPNSWFISKVGSIPSLFSLGSYFATNLFFSVISSWVSWRFFLFCRKILDIQDKYLAIACLFIPTVGFWCSGIIKDTVVYIFILIFIINFFKILYSKHRKTLLWVINLLIASYFILSIRSFVLISMFIPASFIIVFTLNKNKPFFTRLVTRVIGTSFSLGILIFYFNSSDLFGEFSSDSIIGTAETIHFDFAENTTYTGKRYDLGITEFKGSELIKVIPLAVTTSLLRPFIWEADSMLMLINGLENLIILYFSIQIFWSSRRDSTFRELLKNEFFLFSLIYILVMGYFVGITSVLFGVLVRLKAPILPFFLIFVFYKFKKESKTENLR